jgi:hypothetical protein
MLSTALRRTIFLTVFVCLAFNSRLWAQTRPIAIVGGTLIDGTGRAAVTDSVIVIRDGKFQEVSKRAKFRFLRAWKPSMLRVNRIRVSPEFLINERLAVKP